MMRLTEKKKIEAANKTIEANGAELVNDSTLIYAKLGRLENIEEELGVDLVTLLWALKNGFYYVDYQDNDEIHFSRNNFIKVGNQLVETKPCYEVKETTLYSCYNPLKYPTPSKEVKDAHYWSWETCLHFDIKDYGKTWALTREELEHE